MKRSLSVLIRTKSLIFSRHFSIATVSRNPLFSEVFEINSSLFFSCLLTVVCHLTSIQILSKDVNYLRSILGENGVLNDQSMISQFNEDWTRKYKGKSELVLRPKSTEQISKIITYCNQRK
jgi:hypothetical protein